jgi:glutathione S-transferase
MSDEIVLLQYPGRDGLPSLSPPCLKVHLALRLMGVEHRLDNARSPFEVARRSPTRRVPALRLDGRWIAESTNVLDAVEARFPERALSPADALERAHDRLWEHFVTDTLYWLGVYHRWLIPENARRVLDATFGKGPSPARIATALVLVPMLSRRARGQGIAGLSREQAARALVRALDTAHDGLAGGPFLERRPRPGRGDCALAAFVVQLGFGGALGKALALVRERPALFAHVARVFQAAQLPVPGWWS